MIAADQGWRCGEKKNGERKKKDKMLLFPYKIQAQLANLRIVFFLLQLPFEILCLPKTKKDAALSFCFNWPDTVTGRILHGTTFCNHIPISTLFSSLRTVPFLLNTNMQSIMVNT